MKTSWVLCVVLTVPLMVMRYTFYYDVHSSILNFTKQLNYEKSAAPEKPRLKKSEIKGGGQEMAAMMLMPMISVIINIITARISCLPPLISHHFSPWGHTPFHNLAVLV